MLKLNERNALLFWIVLMASLGYVLRYAEAQEQQDAMQQTAIEDSRTTVELVLAVTQHEATWSVPDTAVMTSIFVRRAIGLGTTVRADLLSRHIGHRLRPDRATNPQPGDSRPWIGGLRESCDRPVGWRESAGRWENYRSRCEAVVRVIRATLENWRANDPCYLTSGITPHIWGGTNLDAAHIARRVEEGYRIVHCGPTVQTYMRVPRR